jgi:Putative mono-oxygenase ydhR
LVFSVDETLLLLATNHIFFTSIGVINSTRNDVRDEESGVTEAVWVAELLWQPKEGIAMITAIVQFKLPQPVSRDRAREIFLSTAPRYRDTQGLIRKYYLLSEDGGTAGGVYLWKSREDAQRLYTEEWKTFVR